MKGEFIMLGKLKTGRICHAMYDSIKLESWIEDEQLYFRAYIHHPPSVEFLQQFYQTIGIKLEYTKDYIQVSSKLHLKSYIDENEYLTRRIDTLYKYLILSFQEKVKYPLHSIIV